MMEIRETVKKVVIFTVKGCYRSVCNHPLFVCMLCFLVFLYSSFPFLFSLLVSASPVIVCTAILLGTLLSFGKPNIPEIEVEERGTDEIVPLKTEVSGDNVVFDRNWSVSVERYGDEGENVVGGLVRESSAVENEISGAGSDGGFGDSLEKMSKEVEFDDEDHEERRRELVDLELESKSEMFGERIGDITIVENHYSLIPEDDDEHIDLENDRSPTGSVDSKVVNVDCLDSPPCTPWRHVNQEDAEANEEDEALDSGSDRAESSSPDASLADILPVLDELHPLLDEDSPFGPRPVTLSHDGSDASSEQSARSGESSDESDDDTETQVSEVAENDDEDGEGEDEEETHQEEEDQTKSAIRWTVEDERNLMDLGSSELERNQRLENLIARRRARKTMSVLAETNLIDLETTDFTFSVPPILTTRNNPFDDSLNSYEDMGLPPIPGSAPSVLLHRRNPFDIPYDSSEEKPDLMEDSFQQEFTPIQPKEHFFRRHESFNSWRTPFGINRQEKQDMSRFRPYFVEDRLGSQGTSFTPFERQSSGVSDSKASSVPDTGSISSSENTEQWNVNGEETSVIEDGNNVEDDIARELDLITRASELAGHGSESSEEENSIELSQVKRIPMEDEVTERKSEDTGYRQEAESSLVMEQRLENQFKASLTETYSNVEAHVQRYKSSSSSSSLSEESERIYVEKEVEAFPSFTDGTYHQEDPSVSAEPSLRGSHLNIIAPSRDDAFRDPVYDLSPSSVKKPLSRSSNGSEIDLEHVGVKKSVSFSERVTMIGSPGMESYALVDKVGPSEAIEVDESQVASSSDVISTNLVGGNVNEEISEGGMQTTEHNNVNYEFSEDGNYDIPQIDDKLSLDIEVSPSPKSTAVPGEAIGFQSVGELDGIKEIDENILEELDNVGDFRAKEFGGFDDPEVDAEEFGSTNKEIDRYDEDAKHVSELERSVVDPINALQYDETDLDDSGHLESTEDQIYLKTEEADYEVKSLAEISDIEENESVMAEIEAHFAKTIEAMIIEAEMTSAKTGVLHTDPLPSFVDLALEESSNAGLESITTGNTLNEATIHVENDFQDLDLDQTLEENVEQGTVSGSVLSADGAKDIKGTFPELLVSETQSLDDSESSVKQESIASSSEALGFSDNFTPKDVQSDSVSPSSVEESDTIKALQHSVEESNIAEEKIPETDAIKPLHDSSSALKQESHICPSEALKVSEDVQADLDSPRESKSSAEEPDVIKILQHSVDESNIVEEKIPETDAIKPLYDSLSALKLESHISPSEALKVSEDVQADLDSPRESKSSVEEPDVITILQHSVKESNIVVEKIPETDAIKPLHDSLSALKQDSHISPSEVLKVSEDVQADLDSPRESKSSVEEPGVIKTLQYSMEKSDIVEEKSRESDAILISESKTPDDSFLALKQESHSPLSEAMVTSEDVSVAIYSPSKAISAVEDSGVNITQQNSMEAEKISESDDVLILERRSPTDFDSTLKKESQSSPSEASKLLPEDESPGNVVSNIDSPQEANPDTEESDVGNSIKETDKNSSSSSSSSSSDSSSSDSDRE